MASEIDTRTDPEIEVVVHLKRDRPGLRYRIVADSLRKKIDKGLYAPGQCLPRQHDLARQHGVSFVTLRSALDILEQEGYVVRKPGQGTYAKIPEEHHPKALVVDDDQAVRRLFTRVLSNSGWECVSVGSGEEALVQLKVQRFDLVFLDLIMAGMNGADTIREIRKVDPEAPVVIVTAYPESALMAEVLEAGPLTVIRKPFAVEELETVLKRAEKAVKDI